MTSHSKLLGIKEVAEWIGVSQSAIYKWVGRRPLPTARSSWEVSDQKRMAARWLEEDIQQWIQEKRNASHPE
jgi:predicted DNA-binding transcriptional regulator AlpA